MTGRDPAGRTASFLGSRGGIVISGLAIGLVGVLLQRFGNPPNMGICVACFERDIAGALGFHRAGVVQYLRPEIIGLVLGALFSALLFRDFRPRGGSSAVTRFLLGMFGMIGALVFLGCPWRALLRLSGGDGNAILGLLGLGVGVGIGAQFLKAGYSLGRSRPMPAVTGWMMPLVMVGLLGLLLFRVSFGEGGAIYFSAKGPGSMHAPVALSLAGGVLVGVLAQRSRFCTMGAIRDVLLIRKFHLMEGVIALVVGAVTMNLILGQFHPGLVGQPIAHSNLVWNFLGMVLAGLTFALAGGCPGRQLLLSGEGDGDAAIFVFGMVAGAAIAHNFSLAAVPDRIVEGSFVRGGPGFYGQFAVVVGLVFCLILGATAREKKPMTEGGSTS